MLRIKTVAVTAFEQNARILLDDESGSAAVVDPGGDLELIFTALGEHAEQLKYIILTHAHLDHGGKVASMLSYRDWKTGRPLLVAHRDETAMRANISTQALMFGFPSGSYDDVPEPDIFAEDGAELVLGRLSGRFFHTPGHSPDHIVLYFPACDYLFEETAWETERRGEGPVLFAGDVLFSGSVGRTDLPGGDASTLFRSIRTKLFALPDDTFVLPGHGPSTTMRREKQSNPFLKEILKES